MISIDTIIPLAVQMTRGSSSSSVKLTKCCMQALRQLHDKAETRGSESPRLYIRSGGSGWEDIEFTAYGRYRAYGDVRSYSGLTLVARTNHGDYTDGCSAPGYYARIYTTTGEVAFQKEYYHGTSVVYSASRRLPGPSNPYGVDLSSGLPLDEWIGLKFVVYTATDPDDGAPAVQLKLYLDFSRGARGGDWVLAHELLDTSGSWMATRAIPDECGTEDGHVRDGEPIFGGREYCFLRTDGDSDTVVEWANASVRHISGAATPRTTGCED
ncbi:hypothetical protein EMIHUDRAFT_452883 [Emiliania huxleyi CCMP1516]|uniref:Uncharacterized protein n=2 Tax=Emiliania huxleyi TaxID=2903 RepID=A0A0D3IDB2_EMIH1|nr:hypothetical protein EMIHUDRAFT_452883 [Emiliania huxleyi CCMP1516]EOD09247.1 hypothetical protein EMIHUDRAFT_452883 [Emiliania huxleyi CCMP1516]|eukprot:XP_005761676.1 hypothetical protein EMIHUDRAFT_452883 [Emiliania huxleyi CCMP1516]